jgi:hypothetical protein
MHYLFVLYLIVILAEGVIDVLKIVHLLLM